MNMLSNPDLRLSRFTVPQTALLREGNDPEVKKIAVLRANALGDFIFTLPALEALRTTYPQAEIVLLGLEWHAEFLEGRPSPVDRVIVVPPYRGVSVSNTAEEDPLVLAEFFARMVAEGFDLALQLHGGGRFSNAFVRRLGARLTAGLRTPDSPELDLWVPYSFYQPEILRFLEVVSLVGAVHASVTPHVTVLRRDLSEADEALPPSSRPLAVIHPGAGDPRRRWPVEKFAAVGNALAWAGAEVAVAGTEAEMELVEGVVRSMAAPVHNLGGKTSINGLTGLLSRAAVVVSNDSGPLHLAAAVGAATVGVYWCGNMIIAGPVSRSQHRPAISWQLDCPVCGLDCTQNDCGHQESFVAGVAVEEVVTSALELLQAHQPAASMQG